MPIFTLAAGNRKSIVDQALSNIYAGKSSRINSGLFEIYFNNYIKGIDQVFSDIKPGNKLWDKVEQFKLNAARLAAHKSYKQTAELQNLAGKVKGQAEFKKSAQAIVNKYNRYQAAEYNTVVARARTAKQFARFVGEIEHYPNLEWLRSRSANPRELHLGYVGIILPMNHPFWQKNQPGNLWNCKCDWCTSDQPVTSAPQKITLPARGLEGNPFETGELVTNKHPFYKNISEQDEINITKVANRIEAQRRIDEAEYKVEKGKDGGILEVPVFLKQYSYEASKNYNTYKLLSDAGHSYRILPVVELDYVVNPDAINLDSKIFSDAKHPETLSGIKAIKNSINASLDQQGVKEVVIHFKHKYKEKELSDGLYYMFQNNRTPEIERVIFIYDDGFIKSYDIKTLRKTYENAKGKPS